MPRFDSYIICTSPRSGSTLLSRLLRATGCAGRPDSYFHAPSLSDWLSYFDLRCEDFSSTEDAISATIGAARKQGRSAADLFGFRLQGHSRRFFLQQLALLHPDVTTDAARIGAAFGRTLFIYLNRDNKVEQAVSYVKAQQSGLWHKHADGSELERLSPPAPPIFNREEIARRVIEFETLDHEWHSWFASEGITPLTISYDDLSKAPQEVLGKVLQALGLDPDLAQGVETPTAKLSDATNRGWVRQYVAETLRKQDQSGA